MRPGHFAPDILSAALALAPGPGASMRPGHFAPDMQIAAALADILEVLQ